MNEFLMLSVYRKEDRSKSSNKKDAFQDFENKTSDAWDDGDDDLLVMANIQMSLRDVQSTAKAVMENHSKQFSAQNQQNAIKGKNACIYNLFLKVFLLFFFVSDLTFTKAFF